MNITKEFSWQIFDRIYKRYGLINNILSFGVHRLWRRRLIDRSSLKRGARILDMATGTAEMLSLFRRDNRKHELYGLDMSLGMLRKASARSKGIDGDGDFHLILSDAASLPFADDSFDCVSLAFGIRNMPLPETVLREAKRVLRDGSKLLIVELTRPPNKFIAFFYYIYLRFIIPLIGLIFSGEYSPYAYLADTIWSFPAADEFCALMLKAGFSRVETVSLSLGVAHIYEGVV